MLLTIDIGNTNLTLGLYQGLELGPRWRLATVHERMPTSMGCSSWVSYHMPGSYLAISAASASLR